MNKKLITPKTIYGSLFAHGIFKIPTAWAWLYDINFRDKYIFEVSQNKIVMQSVEAKNRRHKAFWVKFRGHDIYMPAIIRTLAQIKVLSGIQFDSKYGLLNIMPDNSDNPKYHVTKNGFIKISDELIKKYNLNSAVGVTFYDNRIIIKNLKRSECIEFF